MIRRRAVVGLFLLSALLFCAFAAQSAFAAKAVNTTAFTCVKIAEKGGAGFSDAHCDKAVAEGATFKHDLIPLDKTVELGATNKGVTNETKDHEAAIFKSKIGLVSSEITCTTVKANTKKSTAHNVQTEAKHTFTGVAVAEFSECTVNKPDKCTIKQPVVTETAFEGVEQLGASGNEMGVEYRGVGPEETFAEITFEGAECSAKGKTFKIKGSVVGTSGPTTESSQTNKYSGATIVFTPKKEMQKLKCGNEAAEFSLIAIPTDGGAGKEPISITTAT